MPFLCSADLSMVFIVGWLSYIAILGYSQTNPFLLVKWLFFCFCFCLFKVNTPQVFNSEKVNDGLLNVRIHSEEACYGPVSCLTMSRAEEFSGQSLCPKYHVGVLYWQDTIDFKVFERCQWYILESQMFPCSDSLLIWFR